MLPEAVPKGIKEKFYSPPLGCYSEKQSASSVKLWKL